MSGETLQGRRLPDGTFGDDTFGHEPGDYGFWGDGLWFVAPDGTLNRVTDPPWSITVEDDDTVTVSPSIWIDKHHDPPGWHGFLTRGVWTTA